MFNPMNRRVPRHMRCWLTKQRKWLSKKIQQKVLDGFGWQRLSRCNHLVTCAAIIGAIEVPLISTRNNGGISVGPGPLRLTWLPSLFHGVWHEAWNGREVVCKRLQTRFGPIWVYDWMTTIPITSHCFIFVCRIQIYRCLWRSDVMSQKSMKKHETVSQWESFSRLAILCNFQALRRNHLQPTIPRLSQRPATSQP